VSERIKWIIYKGKKILFCDYSNLRDQKQLDFIDEVKNEMAKQKPGTVLLVLADLTNTYTPPAAKKKYEELTAVRMKYKGVDAVIGITVPQKIIGEGIKKGIYYAKDIEDAKEWLVSQRVE
jgi:hypothetical protein